MATTTTDTGIPIIGADPRVIAAAETVDQLRERVRAAERALYTGSSHDVGADRVATLLANPAATLTRAPTITPEDLRDLRAAAEVAGRELEITRHRVSSEYLRSILPARRERAAALLAAAEHLAELIDVKVTLSHRLDAAGHSAPRLAFPDDRATLMRLAERIRRHAETLGA